MLGTQLTFPAIGNKVAWWSFRSASSKRAFCADAEEKVLIADSSYPDAPMCTGKLQLSAMIRSWKDEQADKIRRVTVVGLTLLVDMLPVGCMGNVGRL